MCLFCKIINDELPSYKVYEDNDIVAFLDIFPNATGHTLIVPKKHVANFFEVDEEVYIKMFRVFKKLAKEYEEKLNIDGITMYENYGFHQQVEHFHLHLLPVSKMEPGLEFLGQGSREFPSLLDTLKSK
ncbi:MAG: HIT family protein [Mycoplasmatales bacterium]